MTVYYTWMQGPVGELLLISNGEALTGLHMHDSRYAPEIGGDWLEDASAPPLPETRRQLEEYFEGRRTAFVLPMQPAGTEFQNRVWSELLRIPFGTTITYGELARRVGDPKASRAVGLANGRNPIGIIVPCHRVIGANGKLTGYAGGLDRKQQLLRHESCNPAGIGGIFDEPAAAADQTTNE